MKLSHHSSMIVGGLAGSPKAISYGVFVSKLPTVFVFRNTGRQLSCSPFFCPEFPCPIFKPIQCKTVPRCVKFIEIFLLCVLLGLPCCSLLASLFLVSFRKFSERMSVDL